MDLGPGRILTGRTEFVDAGQSEYRGVSVEEVREGFAARIPLGRYGTPGELARVAAFLASPANAGVYKEKQSALRFDAVLANDSQGFASASH
jgi:NAD(P)-dependent dehydrogenase (short-subunit alcohol dehydrogenase family)